MTTPRSLYKYLIRSCDKLPENVRDYYKHMTRMQFNGHSDEVDPNRVQDIMNQARKDMDWLLNKYKTKEQTK